MASVCPSLYVTFLECHSWNFPWKVFFFKLIDIRDMIQNSWKNRQAIFVGPHSHLCVQYMWLSAKWNEVLVILIIPKSIHQYFSYFFINLSQLFSSSFSYNFIAWPVHTFVFESNPRVRQDRSVFQVTLAPWEWKELEEFLEILGRRVTL